MAIKAFLWSFVSVFIAAVMVLAAGCGMTKETTVRIGYQVIPNTEAVAKANGWHEQTLRNAKVEWFSFDSGRDVNTALASGSIDIGLLGSTLVASGLSQGLDYEVIWLADVIGANEALAVKTEAGIRKPDDLKGKTVAVTFGSTTQYALLGALQVNGIDPKEVNIVDMRPPDMVAAWKRGDIDAGYVWQPSLQELLNDGGEVLLTSGDLVEKGIVTADVIVVRKPFAQKHPELVADYIASQMRAVDEFRTNPQKAAEAVAESFSVSPEQALSMMNELIWLDGAEQTSSRYLGGASAPGDFVRVLADTAAFLQAEGFIKNVPSEEAVRQAVNGQFIERAAEAAGDGR